MHFALIKTDLSQIVRRKEFDTAPVMDLSHKGLAWVPVERLPDPDFDPESQVLKRKIQITPEKVIISRVARDMKPEEQKDRKSRKAAREVAELMEEIRPDVIQTFRRLKRKHERPNAELDPQETALLYILGNLIEQRED